MSVLRVYFILWIALTSVSAWIFSPKEFECEAFDVTCFGQKLYTLYDQQIKDIEEATLFHKFVLPPLSQSHFLNTKPIISLFGQYSSGKTTFTDLLIGGQYSGQFTSLSASTSQFTFINGIDVALSKPECDDEDSCEMPDTSDGKYFVMNSQTPFNIYQYFAGTEVIKSIRAAFVDSPFLRDAYIVDTPGILTDSKDSCNYIKFYKALYFQSDLIVFMFDPHKASDLESAKTIFSLLQSSINKVRFVINKADSLGYRSLLDVYGAIQYNLGAFRIFDSLEINRFYVTSLWNASCASNDEALCEIIKKDKEELLTEFDGLKHDKHKIESKIQSLNERIQLVKKHIVSVESYVQWNCRCGYMSCRCEEKEKEGKEKSAMDDKGRVCYKQDMERYVKALEIKEEYGELKALKDLYRTYIEQLNRAQKDLNNIAETLIYN